MRARWSVGALLAGLACGPGAGSPRVAVLPFESMSEGAGSPALADSLRAGLAVRFGAAGWELTLPGPDVAPAESLAHPDRLGRKLHVDWVLSGSAYSHADTVRVVLHLVSVAEERGSWVRAFTGEVGSLSSLIDSMSAATVRQVR